MTCDIEIFKAFVGRLIQKRVNEVYREIGKCRKKTGTVRMTFPLAEWADPKYQKKVRRDEYKQRFDMDVKLVRVK